MSDKQTSLSTIGLYGILGLIVVLPLLFFPDGLAPIQFTKVAFFAFATLLLFALFVIGRLKEKKMTVFASPLFLAVWGIPFAYLVSSLFADNLRLSLFGDTFGADTFTFMFIGALSLSLVVSYLRTRVDIMRAYLALLGVALLVALFQAVRLVFGPETLSFGIFNDPTGNLIGSWSDLAIFFGLVAILSMLFLTAAQGAFKYILGGAVAVSLFFLALVNFNTVWWIVGLFALGSFVHSIVGGGNKDEASQKVFSVASLVVLAVSIVFLFGNLFFTTGSPGQFLTSAFGISQVEVRPSWQSTVEIGKEVYADNFIFGSGPNTFGKQYLAHKPEGINESVFWNTDFRFGIGFIPTVFITTGILGVVAWLTFFGTLLYVGFRQLVLRTTADSVGYHVLLSTFLSAVYLWALSFLYTPSQTMLLFAFIMTGLFLVSLRQYGEEGKQWTISFNQNPRLGFVVVLVLVVLFLGSVVSLFGIGQRFLAEVAYGQSIVAANAGKFDAASERLTQARAFAQSDRFEQFGVALELQKLSDLVNAQNVPQAEAQTRFQAIFGEAVAAGQRATSFDSANYQNWSTLGNIYQAVVPLQLAGAYDNAVRAYDSAVALNPKSPALSLTRAQLELGNKSLASARSFAEDAIAKKSNYTAAVFLLSQIQLQEGNVSAAIKSAEQAAILAPNDPVAFFQLGVLNYGDSKNSNAVAALERAVALNPQYSNARYFLGLAYFRAGNVAGSLEQFQKIAELNPDSAEVATIISRIEAGQEPIEGLTKPQGDTLPDALPLDQ